MIRSLRNRLLLGIAICSALVLVGSGFVLYSLIRSALVAELDSSLLTEVQTLATLVDLSNGQIESDMADGDMVRFERSDRPEYYQIWYGDGTVAESSTTLADAALVRTAGTLDQPVLRFVTLPDGRPGRTVGITFMPRVGDDPDDDDDVSELGDEAELEDENERDGEGAARDDVAGSEDDDTIGLDSDGSSTQLTIVLARDTLDLERSMSNIRSLIIAVVVVAIVLTILVAAPVVGMGLKPLRTTSARIQQLDSKALGVRIDAASAPAEVKSVIDCLNGLLGRLDDAFNRERAFSSNVAHELRTPLAGLRASIEVALSKPRDVTQYEQVLGDCLAICTRTEGMVECLLTLARVEAGQLSTRTEAVRLGEVLRDTWHPFEERAGSRDLQWIWEVDDHLVVDVDTQMFQFLLSNLFDNAVTYTDIGGIIRIACVAHDDVADIEIHNTATGLSPIDVQHVFDRFWRRDDARSDTGRHAGLGLSLCRELARVQGQTISAARNDDSTFSVRLRMEQVTRRRSAVSG